MTKIEMKAKKLIKLAYYTESGPLSVVEILGRLWYVPGLPPLYEHIVFLRSDRAWSENASKDKGAWIKDDSKGSGRYHTLQELVIELLKYKQENGL